MSTHDSMYDDDTYDDDSPVASHTDSELSAADRRRRKQRHFAEQQAKTDAITWFNSQYPSKIRDVAEAYFRGSRRSPWNAVSDFDAELAIELKSWGSAYALQFLGTVGDHWQQME